MILPRRKLLAGGLVLMVINRLSGLVLPLSVKYLVDNVITKRQGQLLTPLVLAVLAATLIQGITSFTLTQLLSKAGQRLIAELRQKVQQHIGRLSVGYYDANKSGVLVSRIMTRRGRRPQSDRHRTGGVCRRSAYWSDRAHFSGPHQSIYDRTRRVVRRLIRLVLRTAFAKIRPIFRERGKINAEVTGRLTESLGGVRVVKGYHAEEREAKVFAGGVGRLLDNVMKSLTAMSLMSLSATVLMGIVRPWSFHWRAPNFRRQANLGRFLDVHGSARVYGRARVQLVGIGTQITEAFAGLDRTHEVLSERPEDVDPKRTVSLGPIRGTCDFDHVGFAYDPGKPVLHDVSFRSEPGTVTALVGPSGSGKSTIISLIAAFHTPSEGSIEIDGVDLSTVRLIPIAPSWAWCCRIPFCSTAHRENIAFARPDATEGADPARLPSRPCRRVRREIRTEVRHHRRRARRETFRRPTPARLHRARHSGRSAHSDSG